MTARVRWAVFAAAVFLAPCVAADPPGNESCDPDAVYAGEEFAFGSRLRPVGSSGDGFVGFTSPGDVVVEELREFLYGTASDGVTVGELKGALIGILSDGVALEEIEDALVEVTSENGVVLDELEGTRAYVKLRHADPEDDRKQKRKVYVYAIWGTLGELCD